MGKLEYIQTEVEKAQFIIANAKKLLQEAIPDFDNEKITRINKNCFTLNFKDLGKSWSPEYYDFKAQRKLLIEIIENTKPENLSAKLNEIFIKHKITITKQLNVPYVYLFNPDYLKKVQEALLFT